VVAKIENALLDRNSKIFLPSRDCRPNHEFNIPYEFSWALQSMLFLSQTKAQMLPAAFKGFSL